MVLGTACARFEPMRTEADEKLKRSSKRFAQGGSMVLEITSARFEPGGLSPHEKLKGSSNRFAQARIWFREILSLREFGFLKFLKELNLSHRLHPDCTGPPARNDTPCAAR